LIKYIQCLSLNSGIGKKEEKKKVKYMNKKTLIVVTGLIVVFFVSSLHVFAQGGDEGFRVRLESILSKFKNYRFSEISIYKIKDIKDIRNAIKAKESQDNTNIDDQSGAVVDDCVKKGDKAILNFVDNATKEGMSIAQLRREMLSRGMVIPPDIECIYNYYSKKTSGPVKQLRTAYAITTRMSPDQIEPNTIIALIVSTEDNDQLQKNIDNPTPTNVYTYPELKSFEINASDFRANNMYDLVLNAFRQGNVENKTLESQGIGTFLRFAPKRYGVSNSLVKNKYEVTPQDVEKFLQVTDGQPNKMDYVTNEVIVSPDLIRWSKYAMQINNYEDGTSDTISTITNSSLPKYGFELRYGIEDISYPSLWSERMTLSALWQGTKLGLILPTSGWASLSQDAFSVQRKLTYGGVGISTSFDFPILLMPASGIFHISGGYVFGDAHPADYKNRNTDPDQYVYTAGDNDYLVRGNATLLYTFGISIDEDYIMRFGLGGAVFSVEQWHYSVEEDPTTRMPELLYKKYTTTTSGGIMGKIDFMAKSLSTPFGGTLQYFDEALYADLWLQIPLVTNKAYLRLDAKSYFKAFADSPKAWENESVFIPMARFILTF
jgi:hypothetical protein